jgi:hypothetical protein
MLTRRTWFRLRLVAAYALAAALLVSCAAAGSPPVTPVGSSPVVGTAGSPTTGPIATPERATPGPAASADAAAGPSLTFAHVADAEALHGDAVGSPSIVSLPDGSFLMLRREDMPNGGLLLHSADGMTWEPLAGNVPGSGGTAIRALASSGGAVVAFGSLKEMDPTGPQPAPKTAIWRSTDGLTWDLAHPILVPGVDADDATGFALGFIGRGQPLERLLVGDARGNQWRLATYPGATDHRVSMDRVTSNAGGYVAVGSSGADGIAWRSTDGSTWARLPLVLAGVQLRGVVASGDRLVATGYRETGNGDADTMVPVAIASVDGGQSWSDAGIPLDGMTSVGVLAIPGGIVAIATGPRADSPDAVWFSSDGRRWSAVTVEDAAADEPHVLPRVAAWAGGRIVLVGNTVGTGAGGDRLVVWTCDAPGN